MDKPSITLVYITYSKDLEWLEYSLKSLRKYATGFKDVLVIVPSHELDLFLPLEKRYGVWIKNYKEFPNLGMIHHELHVCYSDAWVPDSDYIAHMDPDRLFNQPFDAHEELLKDNVKAKVVARKYSAFGSHPVQNWKRAAQEMLGVEVEYETMQTLPIAYPRWLYRATRNRVEQVHCCPFETYVMKQKNSFPQTMVEFPLLGAWALHQYGNEVHLIDTDVSQEFTSKTTSFWSHARADSASQEHRNMYRDNIATAKRITQ
jgi:hypothetical protein